MTQFRDRKRKRELERQLLERPVKSVVRAIDKEIGQINTRITQRRKEEYEDEKKKAFVETECHCGTMFMRKNLTGNASIYCPDCREVQNKRHVPYAKRKCSVHECSKCQEHVLHDDTVPHEGSLICGSCYRKMIDKSDMIDLSMDVFIHRNTLMGNGIEQSQEYADLTSLHIPERKRHYNKK